MKILIINLLLMATTISANAQTNIDTNSLYKEPYRPQFHFSPKTGRLGDPCGFMYYKGKYHMYWWGKVESTDLVHYHQITSYVMTGANSNINYFTGSAVIDKENTTGFGKNAFIAVHTIYEKDSKKQAQGISFSNDGTTFHYYDKNPVLDIWSTEFRDPTVFWYGPEHKWVMVVAKALEKKVAFYSSRDLKTWEWMSDFGPAGDNEKSWECPDLFQLPVDGNENNKKWVMVVSVNWAKEQYFVGDFDGTSFRLIDNHLKEPLYIDKGLDYYASRTFQDFDGNLKNKTTMGWVSTWDYALMVPSKYGKGFWSLPRDLQLKTYDEGIRLIQNPIKKLETLRYKPSSRKQELSLGTHPLSGFAPTQNVYELDLSFSTDKSNTFGLNLCVGDRRKVIISYDTYTHNFVIDRTHCTNAIIPKFSRMAFSQIEPQNHQLRLHIYVDKSSIEIFTNDGKDVYTLLTYPSERQTGIEVFAMKKGTTMKYKAWMLKSIWQ